MTSNQDQRGLEDQALAWVVRVRDRDFDDWDAFETWLAAAPAHAEAYHQLALADQDMEDILPPETVLPMPARISRTGRRWAWSAVAATVAAMLVGLVSVRMNVDAPQRYQVATQAGERRALVLPGGTSILLNGDSALILDRKNSRFAELKRGEAMFTVRHDAARPFAVQVGDDRLVDVGTRFDVVRYKGEMRVAVAEGAVLYNPTGAKLALGQGDMLRIAAGVALRSKVAPDQVGGWRDGRFVYAGEPLSRVAEDLSRYVGARVEVSADLAGQPFRGVIFVADPSKLETLGPLFRARVQRRGDGWLISPR
jgi:transmembrane sensor